MFHRTMQSLQTNATIPYIINCRKVRFLQGTLQSIIDRFMHLALQFVCLALLFFSPFVQFVVCFSVGYSLKIMRIEYNFDVEHGAWA